MTSSSTVVPLRQPDEVDDPLTAVLRSGARLFVLCSSLVWRLERCQVFVFFLPRLFLV